MGRTDGLLLWEGDCGPATSKAQLVVAMRMTTVTRAPPAFRNNFYHQQSHT
jgi:hypothetical protein